MKRAVGAVGAVSATALAMSLFWATPRGRADDPGSVPATTSTTVALPNQPGEDVAAEVQLLALVNADRASNGVAPVAREDKVSVEAVQHSSDMAAKGDLWHDDEYFSTANHRYLGAKRLGQNVAYNTTVTDAETRLMNDEGHRNVLLDPGWQTIGIGVVRDDGGHIWVTQDFVEPGAVPASSPSSSSGATAKSRPRPKAVPAATTVPREAPRQVEATTTTPPAPSTTAADAPPSSILPAESPNTLPIATATPSGAAIGHRPAPWLLWALAMALVLFDVRWAIKSVNWRQ